MLRRLRKVDYTGKVLGLWTVKQFLGYENNSSRQLYLCVDVFGTERIFSSKLLSNKSFGSHLYDKNSIYLRNLLYAIHYGILDRCYNSANKQYCNYGARGIRVCEEWLGEEGFAAYFKWAISNGWVKGLSIDRIDNNGNYCPVNCRFISQAENARYKSSTKLSYEVAKCLRAEFKERSGSKNAFCKEKALLFDVTPSAIAQVLNNNCWT